MRASTSSRIRTSHGRTAASRSAARPWRERPVLDRLRQRRLVDLLRARPRRQLRAGPHAVGVRHHRRVLLLHGGHLCRGDGDVSRGGRLVELRAPRLQRVRLVLRGVGADAQLRHHRRHLGLLRAALPGLGGRRRRPAPRPRRHHRRHHRGRAAVGRQRDRRQGVGRAEHLPGRHRLPHAAAARARRRDPRAVAADAGRQRLLRRGPDLEGLLPGHPDRHDRLHGDRDDLQHGRGGARRGQDHPGRDQPRAHRGVRHLLHAAGRRAQRPARHAAGRRLLSDAAGRQRGGRRLRRRPDPRRGQAAEPRAAAVGGRDLRRPAGRDDPVHRHQRGHHRRVAAGLLDGRLPPAARPIAPAASEVRHALDRDPHLRRRRLPDDHPRPGRLPGQHLRVRRDAVVHDRPRGGHPHAPHQTRRRAALPGPGQHANPRRRRPAVRRVRRRGHRDGLRGRHRAAHLRGHRGHRLAAAGHRRLRHLPPPPGAGPDLHAPGRGAPAGRRPRGRVRVDPRRLRRRCVQRGGDRHRDAAGLAPPAGHPRAGDHHRAGLLADRRVAARAGAHRPGADRAGQDPGRPARHRATG